MKYLRGPIELVLIAAATVYGIKKFYYAIFPWILSKNLVYPPGTLTPWIESWSKQRDGIEVYALYVAMFVSITTVLALVGLRPLVTNRWAKGCLLIFSFLCLVKLLSGITFTPPSEALIAPRRDMLMYCSMFGLLVLALLYYQKQISWRVENLLVGGVLVLFCFSPMSVIGNDILYSFGPAQKLLEGVHVSQIYFQYDFLMSLIAVLWIKLGLKLSLFSALTQLSFFIEILAIFLLSRSLFRRRSLSLLLLVAIILIRIASAPWDPAGSFQQAPLRLDLWMILFVAIYFLGSNHWLLPVLCGVLVLVHGNFGIIHTAAYLQLVVTLSVLSILDVGFKNKLNDWRKSSNLVRLASAAGFLIGCLLLARFIFSENIQATSYYQKIGIGFIPMHVTSFFWVVPVVISVAFSLLWMMRDRVTSRYLALGFALIYFTLGNCIYFFGRSHELNLFAISIPILFVLFFALDLLDRYLQIESKGDTTKAASVSKELAPIVGLVFILIAAYKCSDQIGVNLGWRFNYVAMVAQPHKTDPFEQMNLEAGVVLKEVRGIVGPTNAIRFLMVTEWKEYMFYSLEPGNRSFSYPLASWIFRDELIQHAQSFLNEGGYLLLDERFLGTKLDGRFEHVDFRYVTLHGGYLLMGKRPPSGPQVR